MGKLFTRNHNDRKIPRSLIVDFIMAFHSGYYGLIKLPFIAFMIISMFKQSRELEIEFRLILIIAILIKVMGIGLGIGLDALMELMNLPVPPHSPVTSDHVVAFFASLFLLSTFEIGFFKYGPKRLGAIIAYFMSLFAGMMILSSVIIDCIESKCKIDVLA